MRFALGFDGGLAGCLALLTQKLRVPPREVLLLVLVMRHPASGIEDGGGAGGGGGLICSVSPPGLANGTRPGGEDDSPEKRWPSQRTIASTTLPSCSVTTSMVPQVYSQPLRKNRYVYWPTRRTAAGAAHSS